MQIEILEDREWTDTVSERWVDYMANHPASRICLPTGETPRPVYTRSAPNVDLSGATVFLLDEFDLPPGSLARCDSMIQRDLLGSLGSAPRTFHRLDVDTDDAIVECARFDGLIADGGLDLTLLGLGGNGHLGLNEPGAGADSATRAVTLAPATTQAASRYGEDAVPTGGLTLGLQRILESDEVWLLVTGSHKAQVLTNMLNGPISSDLPASYLRSHPNTTVFADRSAASGLPRNTSN